MEKDRIRKSISLISLWPVLCILNVSLCYVATFDEREKGKNSAKSGDFWSDEMHA